MDNLETSFEEPRNVARDGTMTSRRKKIIAILIVVVLVGTIGSFVYYEVNRHWTILDLVKAVGDSPGAPGFRHDLAGKTIIVAGKVTDIRTNHSTLGDVSYVELDHREEIRLVQWGSIPYSIGERIDASVSFEWSTFNAETHVYSPQLDYPWLAHLPAMELTTEGVCRVNGIEFSSSQNADGSIKLSIDWMVDPVPTHQCNASLRAGEHSWASEYVDAIGFYKYRDSEIDRISNLTNFRSNKGNMVFHDDDSDGLLDRGDYFVVDNLTRPEVASGVKTYILFVGWGNDSLGPGGFPAYLVITRDGLLRLIDADPHAWMTGERTAEGEDLTFELMRPSVSWDDLTLILSGGATDGYARISLSSANLSVGARSTDDMPMGTLGDVNFFCNVTDIEGNGITNPGDFISLDMNLLGLENYNFVLIYDPQSATYAHFSF